jgi:hypothetical protein
MNPVQERRQQQDHRQRSSHQRGDRELGVDDRTAAVTAAMERRVLRL